MILKFLRYLFHDYAMKEKEEMERIETILRQGKAYGKERERLEELAEWHFENYIEAVEKEKIPWCVKQYLLGNRKKPEPREIYEEYLGNVRYWQRLGLSRDRLYKNLAIGITIGFSLIILITYFKG